MYEFIYLYVFIVILLIFRQFKTCSHYSRLKLQFTCVEYSEDHIITVFTFYANFAILLRVLNNLYAPWPMVTI